MKIVLILFVLCQVVTSAEELTENWQRKVNQVLGKTLENYHYVDQNIDDNFSKRVFRLFLNKIDPNKTFFTENQIIDLTSYEFKIDNDVSNNTFYFYNMCVLRLKKQIEFSSLLYNTILEHPIDLNQSNTIESDLEKKQYAKNNTELTKRWKKLIQYQVNQNYLALYREKYPSKNTLTLESKLIKKAKAKTKKDLDRRFKRLAEKKESDYFSDYLDAITRAFGPHTGYLPRAEKEDFDINMSGKLEGIGAVLREDDGFIKVVRIIPGSASWRQGELSAEDVILKVAQGNKEPVSIVESPVRDAVKLIRGRKGSTVKLTVKKPDGMIKIIPIKRDIVIIKSAFAKSGIFKTNDRQFGYILLPSFYRDFDDNKNRNAAQDVKRALIKLNKLGTDGLILDLRNNGGGSLKDAVEIGGFFIKSGPIVQVSDTYKNKEVYQDPDRAIIYKQPLIILVNTFSASASEIVAAAMQDHGRAIIIGNAHTFGKGTVQKVFNLDRVILNNRDPLGHIKITIQEYFRINGTSTQFTGVLPDITYPSPYDYLDVGEKELKYAFKGSSTTAAKYTKLKKTAKELAVIKRSNERIKTTKAAETMTGYNTFMLDQKENSNRSIRIDDMWANIEKVKEKNNAIDNLTVDKTFASFQALEPTAKSLSDKKDKEDFNKWVTDFNTDFVLNEAITVLSEISQQPSNDGAN